MGRVRILIRALRTLSLAEWRELARAQLALLSAQFVVATRPVGRLVSSEIPRTPALAPDPPLGLATRLAVSVNRVARHGLFRPRCLVRAVALQRMLERRGVQGSTIRVGVRHIGGHFSAHAWVEYGPLVLGDQESHVASYERVADVRLVRKA